MGNTLSNNESRLSRKNYLTLTSFLFSTAALYFVPATEAAAQSNSPDETIQTVTVTALRHDTELEKTPVSVGNMSADNLAQMGARDFIDFAASVPGLTILDNGPGERRPIIRGIEGAGEGEVGIYYDEFPIASSPGATNDAGRFTPDIKLVDVQQVDVLRGPQGTLFGAGSEGGTLQTIFNKPNLNTYSASMSADVGSVSHGAQNIDLNAVANLPLVSGVLGARVVAYQNNQSGFIDNTVLNVKDINSGYTNGGRIALRYEPTNDLTIDFLGVYNHSHFNSGNEATASLGDLQSNVPAYDPLDDKNYLLGMTARYSTDIALVTANASYYYRDLDFDFTFPGLAIPWADAKVQGLPAYVAGQPTIGNGYVDQPQKTRAPTYELRVSSPDSSSPLQWTLGGFYQNRDATMTSVVGFVGDNGRPNSAYPLFQNRAALASLDQRAIYGEISDTFFDKLTITAGGRWESFDASEATAYSINTGGVPVPFTYTSQDYSSSKFIKRFVLSYQALDHAMAYATYSEGFRAGGANMAINNEPNVPQGYGPDSITNYEGGVKTEWFNRKLTLNADYYHMDWGNIQVQGSTPDGLFRFTTNAGQAAVDGVELELNTRPARGLTLGATYGWTFARLTKSEPVNPGLTESGYAGNRLPNVPAQSLNLNADYLQDLTSSLALRYHADYQYVGRSQNLFSPYLANKVTGAATGTADPGFSYMPAYSTVNARVTLQSERWSAGLYAKNLTDSRGKTNILWDSPFTPGQYTYYTMPRVLGVTLTSEF